MKGKFVPESFKVTEELYKWAREMGISDRDIRSQTDVFMDHEFRRPYTDWNRVWRNWMRKSVQIGNVIIEVTLDDEAAACGLTRQPGESDEQLKKRLGIAETKKIYGSGS